MKLAVRIGAFIWEQLAWWYLLASTCVIGDHEFEAYTDGKRTLLICNRCMKTMKWLRTTGDRPQTVEIRPVAVSPTQKET